MHLINTMNTNNGDEDREMDSEKKMIGMTGCDGRCPRVMITI